MKKKLLVLTFLLVSALFVSCSGDESSDKSEPVVVDPVVKAPLPITINKVSSDFIVVGQNLEITGTNFVNKDFPTKVLINGVEITPTEVTDTKIVIAFKDGKTGVNTIKLQIQNVSSSPYDIYVIGKGWNKISALGSNDIHTSNVFDDSNSIFSYIDTNSADNTFWGAAAKLEGKSNGYAKVVVNQNGSYGAFQMVNDKIGVLTNTIQSFYSDNGFETNKKTDVISTFSPEINGLRIGYIDSKSSIVTTLIGSQLYTTDNGENIIKNDPPIWSRKSGGQIRLSATAFGKSSSDNKFYQLGMIYDPKKYGPDNYKNVIMQSETGYNNWIVKDTLSKVDIAVSTSYKFININKMFSRSNNSLVASTDMLQTWNVVKTDVKAFFLRTETQWYILSGDKLFVTKNSGESWELELELPVGSVINDISFSKSKIIVSGNKGLHYLKIE